MARKKARRKRSRPNPFATVDRLGRRRIRRNDGRMAKRTWSTRKGVRIRKHAARRNPYAYENPFATRDADGVRRIHRNDGRWAKPSWSKRAGVRTRKNPTKRRRNPFIDGRGRVRRNDGQFAQRPYSHARDWMTTEHGGIPWLGVRSNPSGFGDRDMDLIFDNPTGRRKGRKKAAKKGARKTSTRKPARKTTRKTAKRGATKKKSTRKATPRHRLQGLVKGAKIRLLGPHSKSSRHTKRLPKVRMTDSSNFRARKLRKPVHVVMQLRRSATPSFATRTGLGSGYTFGARGSAPMPVHVPMEPAVRRSAPRSGKAQRISSAVANPTRRRRSRKARTHRRSRR